MLRYSLDLAILISILISTQYLDPWSVFGIGVTALIITIFWELAHD
jgi:hypothetical protein